MTQAELEARRDSSAREYVRESNECELMDDYAAHEGTYCAGFDFAAALLQGEMDAYSESMRFYMSELQSANAKLAVALETVKHIECVTSAFIEHGRSHSYTDYELRSIAREALSQIAAMDASEGKGKGKG